MNDLDRNSSKIDPSQPVHPLRVTECFHVPDVCTVEWSTKDWDSQKFTVTEPEFLSTPWGTAHAVGRNHAGVLLYSHNKDD